MGEADGGDETKTHLDKSFHDVLEAHLGKEFTIVNPETYEDSSFGHQLQADWYKGKLAAIGSDFIVMVLEYTHGAGKSATKEPVEQYIPVGRIKRVSLMRHERVIHL